MDSEVTAALAMVTSQAILAMAVLATTTASGALGSIQASPSTAGLTTTTTTTMTTTIIIIASGVTADVCAATKNLGPWSLAPALVMKPGHFRAIENARLSCTS